MYKPDGELFFLKIREWVQPPKERCVWGWGQRSRSVGSRKADMVVAPRTLRKIVTLTKLIAKILINICRARCGRKTLIPKKKSQKKPFSDLLPCHAKFFDKILKILFSHAKIHCSQTFTVWSVWRERVQGKGTGKWQKADRRHQLQTATQPSVMPTLPRALSVYSDDV